MEQQSQETKVDVIDEMLKSIDYLITKALEKTTKIYDGIILSQNTDGTYNVQYNGQSHAVRSYKIDSPTVGSMVKIIIPQGNPALSFFI